jgi:hypothetical protein
LELGESNNNKVMMELNLSKLFSQTPLFTTQLIAYLIVQPLLPILVQVPIMNVSLIMNVLLAGNILQIVNQLPKYQNNDDLVSEL